MKINFQFKLEEDGVLRDRDSIDVLFPVTIEKHQKESFQTAGHFIPRMVDDHGMVRDWQGQEVFIGILYHEMKDAMGVLTDKSEVLRIYCDTESGLKKLIRLRLMENYYAMFRAQQVQAAGRDQVKRLMDENNFLREKMGKAGIA